VAAADIPPGWGHNPSKWSRRLPVLLLALADCGIATYLALYQVDVLPTVWEPLFRNSGGEKPTENKRFSRSGGP
jgi:hypothetical protein